MQPRSQPRAVSYGAFNAPMREDEALNALVLGISMAQVLNGSVRAWVGSHSIDEPAAERDELLLGLIELRIKAEQASSVSRKAPQ
jgi:hypothetical protein